MECTVLFIQLPHSPMPSSPHNTVCLENKEAFLRICLIFFHLNPGHASY